MIVLQINNVHYRRGGADAVYLNTAELLQEHGDKVVFFNMKKSRNLPCKDDSYWVSSLESRPKGLRSTILEVRNFFYNPEAAQKIDELIAKERPDIAHIHLFWGCGISPSIIKILKKYNIPLVHTVHDYRMVCPVSLLLDRRGNICERCRGRDFFKAGIFSCSHHGLMRSILMGAEMYYHNLLFYPTKVIDGFIFVSEFSYLKHLEYMPALKDANTTVLYNFTKDKKQYIRKGHDKYFLYFGRISREKGVSTLLKVFVKHPELKLKVVGSGPLLEELKSEISKKNGLFQSPSSHYGNIHFMGYQSGDFLDELIRGARFVCVPSEWYENNPMTIIEAYAMGVPVIGSRIGGIPEIIVNGKTGYTFEAGNEKDLEETIRMANSLEDSDYITMCEASHAFYEAHFSPEMYYKKLIDFYRQTIKNYEL